MPASFRKAFGKNPGRSATFPALVLEKLNESLPQGTRYHTMENGDICIGPTDGQPMTIGGFTLVISPEIEAAIGPCPTPEEVLNYSYNTQKPVRMALEHPGFITVNGEEIGADRFMMGAAHEIRLNEDSFVVYPKPFPGPREIEIAGEGARMTLSVRRVPSESASIEKFESDDQAPLSLRYSIREDAEAGGEVSTSARFALTANPDKCSSLSDVVSVLSIFAAASEGTCTIAGVLANRPEAENAYPAQNNELKWLKKALEIEKELDISFNPANIALDNESARIIEELYVGLVERKPVKTTLSEASLQLDDEALGKFEEAIAQGEGSKFAITFSRPASYNLFGEAITLASVNGVFDLNAQGIKEDAKGAHQLIMKNPPGEPDGCISSILFRSEDQLNSYYSEPRLSEVMELLQQGKTLDEYLREEENKVPKA